MDPHELLTSVGLSPGEVLGQGMEGVVVEVPGDRVAKVWWEPAHERALASATTLDAWASAGLPFATPRVLDVLDVDGTTVTVEARLPGVPLGRAYADGEESPSLVDPWRLECLVTVLDGLASVAATPGMAGLPVLPGEPALDPEVAFGESLAALVDRRVEESRAPLRARLADLDDLVAATGGALRGLPRSPDRPLHGDLVPMNVHVDGPGGDVVALLDLGFLTTVGDPAFDAAVTASIFDMYGPRQRASERVLDAALVDRLGHDPRRLGVYRAAYALATATVYDPDGLDGHFEWCVAMLGRDDVRASL